EANSSKRSSKSYFRPPAVPSRNSQAVWPVSLGVESWTLNVERFGYLIFFIPSPPATAAPVFAVLPNDPARGRRLYRQLARSLSAECKTTDWPAELLRRLEVGVQNSLRARD